MYIYFRRYCTVQPICVFTVGTEAGSYSCRGRMKQKRAAREIHQEAAAAETLRSGIRKMFLLHENEGEKNKQCHYCPLGSDDTQQQANRKPCSVAKC